MSAPSLDELLECSLAAACEAGEIALGYFQKDIHVESKSDNSPVTIADREGEARLRRKIEESFPAHGILGEEFGATREGAEICWMLDPVDGTASFIRGVPLWGVMVGVAVHEEPVVGVVHFPALHETVWAQKGGGAWWNGRRAHISQVAKLADATLLCTDSRAFEAVGLQSTFERLRAHTKFERTWGDCYGHALVATGRAEVMLDPILNAWDACALLPIVEEAGGRFVDWKGTRTIRGGNAISCNSGVCDELMGLIR